MDWGSREVDGSPLDNYADDMPCGVSTVDLLSGMEPGAALRSFGAWSEHLSIQGRCTTLDCLEPDASIPTSQAHRAKQTALVVDVASFGSMSADETTLLRRLVLHSSRDVLLLVTEAASFVRDLVDNLTNGEVRKIAEIKLAETVRFPERISHQRVGLAPYVYRRESCPALTLPSNSPSVTTLMSVDGTPSFIKLQGQRCSIFVWATQSVLDPATRIRDESELELACDRYVPAILFLRSVYGDSCWHTPHSAAAIIIDDPLIRRKYGSIDFYALLESAQRFKYRVTVAFIPWNASRTRKADADYFSACGESFGLCVHGCDHTRHEFESDDFDDLIARCATSVERMSSMHRRTGLRCDPIMVYPQERFSSVAIHALSASGSFIGVTNTRCIPTNQFDEVVTAADLLMPAQDALFGVAMVKRHYFEGMGSFAMSMLLGQPVIMAAHHDDFKNGPAKAELFAREILRLDGSVRWPSIEELFTKMHWRRIVNRGLFEVRFFSNRFVLEHQGVGHAGYRFVRRLPASVLVEGILFDGKDVSYLRDKDYIRFEVIGVAPGQHQVEIVVRRPATMARISRSLRYRLGVLNRRWVSELRDAVFGNNGWILHLCSAIRKKTKP